MRLTVRFLGLDLLDVDLSTDSPSPEPDDDRGSFTSYPMGFVARMDVPHEVDLPDRE